MRRLHSRQRSGVVSQQRLRPRRFDSTVKRVPKLRFEPVSFLSLVCFSIFIYLKKKIIKVKGQIQTERSVDAQKKTI